MSEKTLERRGLASSRDSARNRAPGSTKAARSAPSDPMLTKKRRDDAERQRRYRARLRRGEISLRIALTLVSLERAVDLGFLNAQDSLKPGAIAVLVRQIFETAVSKRNITP